jgi:hypothetical protein
MGSNHFQRLGNILSLPKKYLFAIFGFLNLWEIEFEVVVI